MTEAHESPEDRFATMTASFARTPGVALPDAHGSQFGSGALKVDGSIFAMVSDGHLVVKLPGPRVEEMIEAGDGMPFDAGKGRPLREWVAVANQDDEAWLALAREAYTFVAGLRGRV